MQIHNSENTPNDAALPRKELFVDNLYPIDSGPMSSYDIFRAALIKIGADFTVLTDKGILVYASDDRAAFVFAFDSDGNFTEAYPW